MPEFPRTAAFEDVLAIKETEYALLVVIEGEDVWIPFSQIDYSSEVQDEKDEGRLVVSEWIAREKGLI